MKCRYCGNEIEKGIKYCPNCGTKVEPESDTDGSGNDGEAQSDTRYEDPNAGYEYGGYSYGQSGNGQDSGYSYGQSGNGQDSGYSYGQSGNGQYGGYSYGQPGNSQGGGYSYGQPGNGQDGYNYGQPRKPINGTPYMVFSILVTLCCCLPLGIVSIVYASRISSLQKAGDYVGAAEAAKKAKLFMIIGAVGGLIASVALGVVGGLDLTDTLSSISATADSQSDEAKGTDESEKSDSAADSGNKEQDAAKNSAKNSTRSAEAGAELGDQWNTYTVQINDSVLKFPCTISDVEAIGLTMDTESEPEDSKIDGNDYELVYFDAPQEDGAYSRSLLFVISNSSEDAKEVKDCVVSGVYVEEYDVEDGTLNVVFPGDIRIGTDISTAIEKWGEPNDRYEENTYENVYMWYEEEDYNYCTLYTDPETNKITRVNLDGQDLGK